MLALTIILGVVCVLLLVMLSFQDNKNTKLTVENSLMKGRMETMQERMAEKDPAPAMETLTADGIEEAVRLPSVFLIRQFGVDTKEWEMDLLKHAAHLMSDELIMVKATFDEDEQGTGLRFFVAALDANNASFSANLPRYLSIIEDGRSKMHEIYEGLVKEKRDAALTVTPFLPANPSENKVMS